MDVSEMRDRKSVSHSWWMLLAGRRLTSNLGHPAKERRVGNRRWRCPSLRAGLAKVVYRRDEAGFWRCFSEQIRRNSHCVYLECALVVGEGW